VIGAILSGFAMVLTLLIPLRKLMGLEGYITVNHMDKMNQMVLITSGLVGIAYATEVFGAFYGNDSDHQIFMYRLTGDYFILFLVMNICNVVLPQLLWIKGLRRNIVFTFILSILVNIGMWTERFVIIVTSLSHDYLPSDWKLFTPTLFDIGVFLFSLGIFSFMFLLICRFIPIINMAEVKALIKPSRDLA
jgi:hypothetical protein